MIDVCGEYKKIKEGVRMDMMGNFVDRSHEHFCDHKEGHAGVHKCSCGVAWS